ncbi:MAG: Crp/Fnr family transcriptional regulator [Ruminococcaceae bacterium]|nr:Crp/Fnr family transcriptional regulator [Oscillospiraceae bacterium]
MKECFIKEYLSAVKMCPLFKDTEDEVIEKILSDDRCELILSNAGDMIYEKRKAVPFFFIVVRGNIRIYTSGSNSDVLLNILSPSDVCGIATVLSEEHEFPTKIMSYADSAIICFSRDLTEKVIELSPRFALNYVKALSNKIMFLNKRISSFTASDSVTSLSSYILSNAKDGILNVEEGYSALAKKLCMGRSSLYRSIDSLKESGAIDTNKKSIVILNRDILSERL